MINPPHVIAALKRLGYEYTRYDVEEIQKLYKMRISGSSVNKDYLEALIKEYYSPQRYLL
jgi:hypothetical protein